MELKASPSSHTTWQAVTHGNARNFYGRVVRTWLTVLTVYYLGHLLREFNRLIRRHGRATINVRGDRDAAA
jgi:hypothetical protein